MTKHYCDKCEKECDWRDMIRMAADREIKNGIAIHRLHELCEECYRKMFIEKDGDRECR